MNKHRTLIATIPGMIGDNDLIPLRKVSEVEYFESSSISETELAAKCAGYDYLMLNMDILPKKNNLKLTETFYSSPNVKNLRTIAVDMTGMDYFSPKMAAAAGVMLQNIPHYSSQSVAESILSEILLHSRQRHLAYMDEIKQQKVISRKGINLVGRTAGIIGYGSIGSNVSKLLLSLGMKVIVWNRTPKSGIESVSLEELFTQSDVICIAVKTVTDGVEANVNMVGHDLLELCKGTIIVNLANESLVDSDAILKALSSNKVVAYSVEGSDNIRNILTGYSNIHFAPNNAWDSDESMQTLRDVWVKNVISVIDGSPQNVYHE